MPPAADELASRSRRDFPIFSREFARPAARVPRLGRHLAEAGGRDRGAWPSTCASHNANVHRGVYALAQEADAAFEGAPRRGSPASRAAEPDDHDLHQERHRGDQPRRLRVGSRERRRGRRGADHADGAPREHRPLAGALPRARRARCATWRWTSTASSRSRRSTPSWRAATCGWSPSRTSRTCSARSTRSPR